MKIILANGTELEPLLVTGEKRTVQGAERDTLLFAFPGEMGMDTIDAMFTDAACETIIIVVNEEEAYTHKGYTIRAGLTKKLVAITSGTEATEAVYENRITVAMSQRTYAETQLASLTDTIDVLVMESLLAE